MYKSKSLKIQGIIKRPEMLDFSILWDIVIQRSSWRDAQGFFPMVYITAGHDGSTPGVRNLIIFILFYYRRLPTWPPVP